MSYLIKIDGKEYCFLEDSFEESSAIAPMNHVDESGELDYRECFKSESFAHFYPDQGILRFGKKIADLKDIEIVKKF